MKAEVKELEIVENDLSERLAAKICDDGEVSVDIETTGLDWKNDQLATIQLYTNSSAVIYRVREVYPSRLIKIFENPSIKKIFHHAMFDVRFLISLWDVSFKNVVCTKIASKLLNKEADDHNLKVLLNKYLGISIKKDMWDSNWLNNELSDDQITYAINDVIYLSDLFEKLEVRLQESNMTEVANSCFYFIPYKAWLQVNDYKGVFKY